MYFTQGHKPFSTWAHVTISNNTGWVVNCQTWSKISYAGIKIAAYYREELGLDMFQHPLEL